MFRSIRASVAKRENTIEKATEQQGHIDRLIQEFLKLSFGHASSYIRIEARIERKNLFLKTNNKIAANEILFRSASLCEFLKKNSVVYEKLVIQ